MSSKSKRFPPAFYAWFKEFFKKRDLSQAGKPPDKTATAEKYFSMMLGDFFGQLEDKDNPCPVDSGNGLGNPEEFESNPMLDFLNKKRENAQSSDMHESTAGEKRSLWSSTEGGERLSTEKGDGSGLYTEQASDAHDSFKGSSSDKLGRDNQHSRISAKLNSVVSEEVVPEHVVFNEIGQATQIFDWRRILRQNGSFDVDWSYRNALIEDGIVRPTLEAVPVAVTEILLDTSGSIDEPLLKRFLQECRNILPYSKVKVGCFDTRFYGFKDINSLNDLESMVFEGRHGTSFTAAAGAFSGRADNRIIFTDGDAPMPSQRMDIIWIVFGGKRISPNGGRVFYVDNELLKRMKEKQTPSKA